MSAFTYTRELLAEIREFVDELYGRLGDLEPYETLSSFVEEFVVSHNGKPLAEGGFYRGDPGDIRSTIDGDRGAYSENLPHHPSMTKGLISEDARESLYKLLDRLPYFVVNGKTTRKRKELVAQLLGLCEDYLELVGAFRSTGPVQGRSTGDLQDFPRLEEFKFEDETDGRVRIFDPRDAELIGHVHRPLHWIVLYRKSIAWLLVTMPHLNKLMNFIAPQAGPRIYKGKYITEQEAVDWMLLNDIEVPPEIDISDRYVMQPIAPRADSLRSPTENVEINETGRSGTASVESVEAHATVATDSSKIEGSKPATHDTGSAPTVSANQVLLCYSPADFYQAAKLRQSLLDAGEQVWWDRDILAGQDHRLAIRQAMRKSCAVVLCLSQQTQDAAQSDLYSAAADAVALFRQYAPGSIFLIPVRFSDCEIPSFQIDANRWLDSIQHVDLFPPSKRAEGVEQLLKALRSATARAASPPGSAATGFGLLDDLVAAIDADEFSGSHLAPLLRDACRRPAEMATSADYLFEAIRQTIDIENERLAKIGEGAGKPDWHRDYAWVATNVSIALAHAVRRSAGAQEYVVQVAKGVFAVSDFELVLDLPRENEFFDVACRAASGELLPEEVFEILKTAEVRRVDRA